MSDVATPVTKRQSELFVRLAAYLEANKIEYAVLHGHEHYPDYIPSDLDFVVSAAALADMNELLRQFAEDNGLLIVQRLQHETSACFFVLADSTGQELTFLLPDPASDYRRNGRMWLRADQLLSERRLDPRGFWITSPQHEFEYLLIKRLDKQLLTQRSFDRLMTLYAQEERTREVLARLLPRQHTRAAQLLRTKDFEEFSRSIVSFRSDMLRTPPRESRVHRLGQRVREARRLVGRLAAPGGYSIAVLGMDGSGKSTVLDALASAFSPAFRGVTRFHFRPNWGRKGAGKPPTTQPHSGSPRDSFSASIKLAWVLADYWVSNLTTLRPLKIRSHLILFDRYFHDMLVDPLRARLHSDFPVTRALARLVPEPDLWIYLDVEPERAIARKNELDLETASRLRARYREFVASLGDRAITIDANADLESVLNQITRSVLGRLHSRFVSRYVKT